MRRVLVVGGGFAGLSAARTLKSLGIPHVTILEAGQNVGGRARTLRLPGLSLEVGTTWIHGLQMANGQTNPIFQAAQEARLLSASPELTVWDEATFLLPGQTEMLSTPEQLLPIARAFAVFDNAVEAARPDEQDQTTLGDLLDVAWATLESAQEGDDAQLMTRAWAWRERLQRAMDGTLSSHDFPAAAAARYAAAVEGRSNAPIPAGFQALPEYLARDLDVVYGQHVERVVWDGAGVKLFTKQGKEWKADAAIVTVSLGVLKATHDTLFSPPLPPAMIQSMDALRMGVVEKLFLVFLGTSDARENCTREPVTWGLLWGDGPSMTPEEASAPTWLRSVFSFRFSGAEIKAETNSPLVAVVWVSGPGAKEVGLLPDEQVVQDLKQLPTIFPGLQLPEGASWDRMQLHRSTWGSDPCFLGSYSYPRQAATTHALNKVLYADEQRRVPRLVLAGEACASDCFGTAQGAFLSGAKAARLLVAASNSVK